MPGRWVADQEEDEGGGGGGGPSWVFLDGAETDMDDAMDDDYGQNNGTSQGHGHVFGQGGGCEFELPSRPTPSSTGQAIPPTTHAPISTWDAGFGYETNSNYVPLSRVMSGGTDNGMLQPSFADTAALFDLSSPTITSSIFPDLGSPVLSTPGLTPGTQADNAPRKALRRRKSSRAASFHSATLFDQTFVHPLSGLSLVMGYNTSLPKSRLDMYITAMRQLLLTSSEQGLLTNELRRAVSAEGVLWTVREAWPAAEGYWNLTATFRGFLGAELWRNFPCEKTYKQLPPAYRPTRAQLMIPHAPMIDWLPWPDVRDLAIRYQDQLDVDALFRMAIHNVVAHRKTRRRSSTSSILDREVFDTQEQAQDQTSFRVWDLVCLEKANGTEPLADSALEKRPIPRSPGVKAVLRAYDLEYDEFDTQKLDDCFFEAFPALYCDTAASNWKVEGFPGMSAVDVGRPISLTAPAVLRLKSRIESMVGGTIHV